MMAMKSSTLRRNFLEKNMNRQFMPRPSMKYLNFSNLDPSKDYQGILPENVIDGLSQILSVNGFAVQSNFIVSLTIRIRGGGGLFDKVMHTYTKDFPIYIRSKPLKNERVADVEQLGLLPHALKTNV